MSILATSPPDVPSPIDLRRSEDAHDWAEAAMVTRPYRSDFFKAFAAALAQASQGKPIHVLELGSGPGFLAEHLLKALPTLDLVALDFSPAMHELAAQRLGPLARRVTFVERSFLDAGWAEGLGPFHAVVTLQAVHELRHKRHAPALHAQVRQVLVPAGHYLVCDHFAGEGGMTNDQLYMSRNEQREALSGAGFENVEEVLVKGSLTLHHAQT
jgi:SAM-dependent methyltransferase